MNRSKPRTYVDEATYAVTGRQYVAPDQDGHMHVIVKSAELAGTNWNTYTGSTAGRWLISSREHRTLAAAKAHLLTVGGWAE